jgi:ankyrin repeat protein
MNEQEMIRKSLFEAIEQKDVIQVKEILNNPKTNPNVQTDWGDTALITASYEGELQIVQAILEHPQTNPNIKNCYGFSALHYASREGHSQVVQAILEHPQTNINLKDAYDYTALHTSSQMGNLQVVETLLEYPNVDVTITNNRNKVAWAIAQPKIHEQFPKLNPIVNEVYNENLLLKSLLKEISSKLPENSEILKKIQEFI